jgi:NAD(P)-dependent dehydrogenase (short-subunit alcohol dehydrogenase family)
LWLAAGGLAAWVLTKQLRKARALDLRGRNVLLTGGSRGLGLVPTRALVAEGARVAICARDGDELERAAAEPALLGRVLPLPCDVTDRAQVEWLVKALLDGWGRIDVLINNAGIISVGPVETMTMADYEQAMATHFWGPLYTTLAVLPAMKSQGEGRIVNISSIGGKVSVPHLVPYNASKFALVGLSEGLRAELAKDNILVTTVCPGLMRTGSPRHALFKGQHRAEYTWFALSDSLPGLSMSAERAAAKIIDALKHGDAEVVLSWLAKFATTVHDLAPGLTTAVLDIANRLLPGPGGIGTRHAKGADSESALAPSLLTTLTEMAARRNNELEPETEKQLSP